MILLAVGAEAAGVTTYQALFVGSTILVAALGGLAAVIVKRLREPTRIETLWERLDAQDDKIQSQDAAIEKFKKTTERAVRRADAAVGVVRDLVRQWPHGHIPRLNPVDIDELDEEGAIPEEWKVKP